MLFWGQDPCFCTSHSHLPMGETQTSLLQEPTSFRYLPKTSAIPPERNLGEAPEQPQA